MQKLQLHSLDLFFCFQAVSWPSDQTMDQNLASKGSTCEAFGCRDQITASLPAPPPHHPPISPRLCQTLDAPSASTWARLVLLLSKDCCGVCVYICSDTEPSWKHVQRTHKRLWRLFFFFDVLVCVSRRPEGCEVAPTSQDEPSVSVSGSCSWNRKFTSGNQRNRENSFSRWNFVITIKNMKKFSMTFWKCLHYYRTPRVVGWFLGGKMLQMTGCLSDVCHPDRCARSQGGSTHSASRCSHSRWKHYVKPTPDMWCSVFTSYSYQSKKAEKMIRKLLRETWAFHTGQFVDEWKEIEPKRDVQWWIDSVFQAWKAALVWLFRA